MRPRIRTIKPEIWQDERIGDLCHGARLLFIGLITMADDEGRVRELPATILGHVFPYDNVTTTKLARWLREVEATGMVIRYAAAGRRYIAFKHWTRHQKVDRPNESDLPEPPGFADQSANESEIDRGSVDDRSLSLRAGADPIRSVPDPIVVSLCELLADRIRANDPKSQPKPESDRWLTDMRLLVAERGEDEVRRVIVWCQQDSFWRSNVLSPGKLRKQFTQLVLKEAAGRGGRMVDRERASRGQAAIAEQTRRRLELIRKESA